VSRANWPKRLYCSKACQYDAMRGRPNPKLGDAHRGKKQPPEVVAKRTASIKRTYAEGRVRHARANLGLRGEETSQWKGDDVSYRAAHFRLYSQRGKPAICDLCGQPAHEWALKDAAEAVKVQQDGRFAGKRYSPRIDDYFPACRSCHRSYDGRERDPVTGRYV
jgi:hypothetical protein